MAKSKKIKPAKERLARLRSLRSIDAPKWIVKTEQIALVLGREGLRNYGIGKTQSKRQGELYNRHVLPLLSDA